MTDMLQNKLGIPSWEPSSRVLLTQACTSPRRGGGVRHSTLIGCDAGKGEASPVIGRASELLLALAESMTLFSGQDFADD